MQPRRLKRDEGYAMPPHRPYYPPLPTEYREVRFQLLHFRADPGRLRDLLPEPLEPHPDGLCVAFTLDVPFSSDYGPFQESGVQEQVTFHGQAGFYCSHVFLNNAKALVSGRERWGTPKEFADVRLEQHQNILTGTTILEGLPGMIVRTELGKPVGEAEMPPLFPSYRLKIIPRADGPGFVLKQLVTVQPGASTTHLLYKGSGDLWLHPAAGHGLSALQPIEMLDAFYLVASYTESYGEIVYDYTAP